VQFVLVHSPLVGPGTWSFVATELRNRGALVVVPDLRAGAERGDASTMVDMTVAALDASEAVSLVAHSGAGILLPLIAARLPSPCTLCFVDAGLPNAEGETTPSRDFIERLRELAVDGILPKWSSWWGPEVMATLVPDVARRAEIESEQPAVPLALYETSLQMPTGWRRIPSSYILLSEGYERDANLAQAIGWPVVRFSGTHLDIVNNPEQIAEQIYRLAHPS
jgi:hypothetical protein